MVNCEIKESTEDRGRICNDLLRSLPLWFGIESAIRQYVSDVETMPTFVASVGGNPIGFLSLHIHNEWTAEIHVIAVRSEFHRNGIGRRLFAVAEDYLRKRRCEFLSVKTISASSPNKEYESTRRFYFSMGFKPVEEFRALWGEANPCLLMIKSL